MLDQMKYVVIGVDDDPMINVMLRFQLNKLVNSSTTLVEMFSKPEEVELELSKIVDVGLKIGFVIVDYQMPNLNGADLIRRLKLHYPDLICIMLSGQANNEQVSRLIEDNLLTSFIRKPWDQIKLKEFLMPYIPD
jgi:CheY-like chemotaxis protein